MRRVLVPAAIEAGSFAASGAAFVERLHGETMGTSWSVALRRPAGTTFATIERRIEGELGRVVAEMSHWRSDSDLARFNCAPAATWHALPDGFYSVLAFALALAEQSDGAYDPTLGRLVGLWGFGPGPANEGIAPAEAEIARALATSGWHRLVLCQAQRRAYQPGGLQLDLSSIAKGYAVDRVMASLQEAGVASALVEIGGELKGHGVKADGTPWWVAIESPGDQAPAPMVIALHGLAVATSGDYRRFAAIGGRRFAHTVDPRNGWPVADAPAAVTVLHSSCMQADALSTLLTVLGPEAGMAYAERHDVPALFIVRNGEGFSERLSPTMAAMLA